MTSSAGLQTGSNSFTVRSDDDIIIAPNSSVALLNGFISSGIVADYKIDNTQTVGLPPAQVNGDKLGDLFLVANTTTTPDRARPVILSSGEYGVTPMLNEMTDAFNRSLIYRSLPTTLDPTSQSFTTPPELDFGLEVGCSLNANNQITIKYNSAAQKTTADLDYTNKNNGVNVAVNGDISYTTPGGSSIVSLDTTLASDANHEIFTTDVTTGKFAVLDNVNLSSADGQNVFSQVQINNITAAGSNADTALVIDPTVADDTNNFVYSTQSDFLVLPTNLPFSAGQLITMDDGAGVAGTPSANTIYAKVDVLPTLFTFNPKVQITESHAINGFVLKTPITITTADEITPDIEYKLTLDVPFADVDLFHIVEDAIFYITDSLDDIIAVAKITAVTGVLGQPDITKIDVDTQPFDTQNISTADMIQLNTIEQYVSLPAQSQDFVPEAGDIVGIFEDDILLYTFEIDGIVQATAADDILITATPGSLVTLSADETTLIIGMDGMETILNTLFGLNPSDLARVQLICMSKILSIDPVDKTADFKDADVVVFGDSANPSSIPLSADSTLFSLNGDNYTLFQLAIDPTPLDEYKIKQELIAQCRNSPNMYKTSNGKRVRIHLSNFNPNNNDLNLMTRIWAGTDIQTTSRISLIYPAQGPGFSLANFSLMLKGSLKPANVSYVVEDTRLNHACGRVSFLVSNAAICEFGCMPETANFTGQSVSSNDVKVAITFPTGVNRLCYEFYRGQRKVDIKVPLQAQNGDRVTIEWGVSSPATGREYISTINGGTNPGVLTVNDTQAVAAGNLDASDSRKILISILRNNKSAEFIYLGCPIQIPDTTDVNELALCQTVPWTPRASPYIEPEYWTNDADLHVYVCPDQATVRILELSPTPQITFDGTSYTEFDGTHSLLHSTLHAISDPAQIDQPHKLKSFANVFNFEFTNIDLQRKFGYKTATNILNGAAGSWSAEKSYLSAYLPENLTILLDTLSNVQSYDLEQNGGRRRSIIGTVVNSQQSIGEIYIEPNNLYHIKLGNKEPINLRRFVVSLEDFYGTPLRLQSARAVINLLFNEGTA
jgi:hypothetical protein